MNNTVINLYIHQTKVLFTVPLFLHWDTGDGLLCLYCSSRGRLRMRETGVEFIKIGVDDAQGNLTQTQILSFNKHPFF